MPDLGVHNQDLMDDVEAYEPFDPQQRRKEIQTIHLYFHAFYNQNIKFFTSRNCGPFSTVSYSSSDSYNVATELAE